MRNLCDKFDQKPKPEGEVHSQIKFTYNTDEERCEMFAYSGCGGSGNRFDSLLDCHDACSEGGRDDDEVSLTGFPFPTCLSNELKGITPEIQYRQE